MKSKMSFRNRPPPIADYRDLVRETDDRSESGDTELDAGDYSFPASDALFTWLNDFFMNYKYPQTYTTEFGRTPEKRIKAWVVDVFNRLSRSSITRNDFDAAQALAKELTNTDIEFKKIDDQLWQGVFHNVQGRVREFVWYYIYNQIKTPVIRAGTQRWR